MGSEWLGKCRGQGISVEGDYAVVTFSDDRRHRVRLEDAPDAVRLAAVVIGAAAAAQLPNPLQEAWTRNRGSRLAHFYVDDRGRVVAEAFLPLAGLTRKELVFRLMTLAEECDRFEQKLTGRDVE